MANGRQAKVREIEKCLRTAHAIKAKCYWLLSPTRSTEAQSNLFSAARDYSYINLFSTLRDLKWEAEQFSSQSGEGTRKCLRTVDAIKAKFNFLPSLRPIFVRISWSILKLHHLGWRPMQDALDCVLWSPREFNTVADHAVNVTLDSHQSWACSDNARLQVAFGSDCFLRLCVDGGLRGNGEAAAGLAL